MFTRVGRGVWGLGVLQVCDRGCVFDFSYFPPILTQENRRFISWAGCRGRCCWRFWDVGLVF